MQEQRWSGDELISRLQVFERELRAAGLADNTVNTYVGRSETFVRWLRGGSVRAERSEHRNRWPNQRPRQASDKVTSPTDLQARLPA